MPGVHARDIAGFGGSDAAAVADFWRVYEDNWDAVAADVLAAFRRYPMVSALIDRLPEEELARAIREHRAHVNAAVRGDWSSYEEGLRESARRYGEAGLDFPTMYLMWLALLDALAPRMIAAYASSPARLDAALSAMRRFVERGISVRGTELVAAKQQSIDEARSRYEAILEASIDGIVTINHEGVIVTFNRAAEQLFGRPAALAIGSVLGDLIVPARLRAAHTAGLARCVATGNAHLLGKRVELPAMRGDGTEFPAEIVISRIAHAARPMFTAFIRDVTSETRGRDELESRRAEAEAATVVLSASAAQLRALAARLASTREEERTRISREIHDELGGQLTGLKLDIAWLRRRYERSDRGLDLVERLEAMTGLVDATIKTVRSIAVELRPAMLDDLGLAAALEWHAHEWELRSGVTVHISLPRDDIPLSTECATALFRVFQEILTNVARHAGATEIDATLERADDSVVLRVHDNGRGITKAELSGAAALGLLGMRERMALVHGQLEISGVSGAGTTVTASALVGRSV